MGLNERLKESRIKAGMTQKYVEEKTGIKVTTLSNWENNVSSPDAEKIKILCELYGVNPNLIFEWEDNEKEGYYLNKETAKIAQEIYDNPDLRVLFDTTRKVKPEDLKFIAEMVKRMSGEDD